MTVLNRIRVNRGGQNIGSLVTPKRDTAELVQLERELKSLRRSNSFLRAQVHEFNNQLHAISGMLQMGRHGEAIRYIRSLNKQDRLLEEDLGARVHDSCVSGLLIAKSSFAAQQHVVLSVAESTVLDPLDPTAAIDVVTVIGNLVDNAVDAAQDSRGGSAWVEVGIRQDGSKVTIVVRNSGSRIPLECAQNIFRNGYTTKSAEKGERGIGLALTRAICERRGGEVAFTTSSNETVFRAVLNVVFLSKKQGEVFSSD